MDVLCLMGLFPKDYENTINQKSIKGVQNAANKLQWGIVEGLSQQPNIDVTILNSLYIGSFPKRYEDLIIPSFPFSHVSGASDINVGFVNLSVFKIFSKYYSLKKEIDIWFENHRDNDIAVIAYAMTSPFVELLYYIKNKYRNVKTCLVVPDLPEYMNVSAQSNIIYSCLKKVQVRYFKKILKRIDGFVLLTKYMADWFNWDINFTVIEGISLKTITDIKSTKELQRDNAIVYAGMLEEKYGVLDLVNSFIDINKDGWTLELFGNGSLFDMIKQLSINNPSIRVHGIVPNEEVLRFQKIASILVNPRNNDNVFTKYSFPSKIIEYMGSGTPMVAYKLDGMPDEYTHYFFVVEDVENGLTDCLKRVIDMSAEERNDMGMKALEFVANNKSTKSQGANIISFLQSI